MAKAELSGVTVVAAGSFNPAIINPTWLAQKELLPENVAEHAMSPAAALQMLITPQVAVFQADWLSVQVTQAQAVFSTIDMGRELDLRDLAIGILTLLPETPVSAIGINADVHFRVESEAAWHAFGDRFLPKENWEPLFDQDDWKVRDGDKRVGMRSMTVEGTRRDEIGPGWVRVELAPSIRVQPNGVYVGVNGHFQLGSPTGASNGSDAMRVLREHWDRTRQIEADIIDGLMVSI